ncbi:PqqD family protein [Clostridium tagluense]|uniref:PqqD family protein n=1 Tax=Clostridium tagluense TaxID=360422 RepID=UPI001CF4A6C5|nr:PqqD family protein [Clostridium tagluense]MCB2300096.1 PqqD family protein [Clostridium tagluense]
MKISEGFSLRNIAGENIVVPIGTKNISFKGMITLNNSGVFLWKQLQTDKTEEELLKAMLGEYEIDEVTARGGINKFIEKLKNAKIVN